MAKNGEILCSEAGSSTSTTNATAAAERFSSAGGGGYRSNCSENQQQEQHHNPRGDHSDGSTSSSSSSFMAARCLLLGVDDETAVAAAAAAATSQMSGEIEAAVAFLSDIVKTSRFSEKSAENFRQALTTLLKQHYEGHWYPNDPFKGSGYRCLRVNGVMNPLLTKAAQLSGLPLSKFRQSFPVEFTVWVDPGDVSVRYGEDGSIGCVYPTSGKGLKHDHQQMEELKRLVEAQRHQQTQQYSWQQQFPLLLAHRACSTPPPAPVCEKVHVQANLRRTPPTFAPGSSPPSSFMFSPYDGKSMKVPLLTNSSSVAYSSSSALHHNGQQPPQQQQQQQPASPSRRYPHFFDRRTPPLYATSSGGTNNAGGGNSLSNSNSPSSYHHQQQQQQQGIYYGATAVSGVDLMAKNSQINDGRGFSMMLDCDLSLARHTPAFRTLTPTNVSSTTCRPFDSSPSSGSGCSSLSSTAGGGGFSDWANNVVGGQSPPRAVANNNCGPMGSEYQFYTNTHFGSAYAPTTTPSTVGQGVIGGARPPAAAVLA